MTIDDEPYIVNLRIEVMHHLIDASYMWDGWNDLYAWELKCDKSFEEMKSEILVRACHVLTKVLMRNKKSPDDYAENEYRKAIKESKRMSKVSIFKTELQRNAITDHKVRVIESQYDWNRARRLYYRHHRITPATKVRCANPDCKKSYSMKASEMELHHLLPRSVAPSLTYDVGNMCLICKTCHKEIHKGWEAYWTLKRKVENSTIDL